MSSSLPASEQLFELRYHDLFPNEMVCDEEKGLDATGQFITHFSFLRASPQHSDRFSLHFNDVDYEVSIQLKSFFRKGLIRQRGPLHTQEATLVLTPTPSSRRRFAPDVGHQPDKPEMYFRTHIDEINDALAQRLQDKFLQSERTASSRITYSMETGGPLRIGLQHDRETRKPEEPKTGRQKQMHMRRPYHPPPPPQVRKEMVHPFVAFSEILDQLKMIEAECRDNNDLLSGEDYLPSNKHRASVGRSIDPLQLAALEDGVEKLAQNLFPDMTPLPETRVYEEYGLFRQQLESLLRKALPSASDEDRGTLQRAIVDAMTASFKKDKGVTPINHREFRSRLKGVLGLGRSRDE